MSDTKNVIRQRRELLQPTEPRQHHVPDWFRRAILREYGCRRGDTSGAGVVFGAFTGCGWLDHWGSIKLKDGRVAFISEPYGLTSAQAGHAVEVANRLGCELSIDAGSWWFPGSTVRLVFTERKQG